MVFLIFVSIISLPILFLIARRTADPIQSQAKNPLSQPPSIDGFWIAHELLESESQWHRQIKNNDHVDSALVLAKYKYLATNIIRKEVVVDERVRNIVMTCSNFGWNSEKIILCTFVYDIAMQLQDAEFSPEKWVSAICRGQSILELGVFERWKSEGKVSDRFVNLIWNIFYRFKPDAMLEAKNVILSSLNKKAFNPVDFYYFMEIIDHRVFVKSALKTLPGNSESLSWAVESNATFCVRATLRVMHAILELANVSNHLSFEDDIFTCGIFLAAICAHLTRLTQENFKATSSESWLGFFGEAIAIKYESSIMVAYADIYKTELDMLEAIGQSLVNWISNPDNDHFETLVRLYCVVKHKRFSICPSVRRH